MKKIVLILVVLGLIGVLAAWYSNKTKKAEMVYRTVQVTRGDLLAIIEATGTVEPEEVVDVGAQVAGQILTFGTDKDGKEIDYGSEVEDGTVLAKIDDTVYVAELAQAEAQLRQAQAGVLRSESDLIQMRTKFYQAQRDWERAQKLGPSEALAQITYDGYKSAFETAQANVAVGDAAILQAKASVAQAEAILQKAKRNLSYCVIKSPVRGVIIDRRVNIGQTVVASLNAPSLFLIAKDLKRMQVWVSVNEADIGNIRVGQPATFTVDAFAGQVFQGEVGKIRLNATMTQNVVTFVVEVNTDNSSGKLLPYLTANVQFELASRQNILLVPNAALRWYPEPGKVSPEFSDSGKSNSSGSAYKNAGAKRQQTGPSAEKHNTGVLWIQDGNFVKPIAVKVELTDGSMTEVQGEGLSEGLAVIVGQQQNGIPDTSGTTNPFAPPMMRGRR